MAPVSLSLRNAARLVATLLAVGCVVLSSEPGFAAPPRWQEAFRFSNNGAPHFNIDPGPCGGDGQRQRGRRFGGAGCPSPAPRNFPRSNGGPRGPGSSAFGLQFDNDGY